jgi:hypothetical protein
MTLKITPLIIASIGVIIFGLYYIFYKWDTNIGPFQGLLLIAIGLICIGIYFIFRIILHSKFWMQLLCEATLIVFLIFLGYKQTKKVLLTIPAGFKGDILIIYGVKNAPKLKPENIFERNIKVDVPASGIIMISNSFAEKYINNLLVIDAQNYLALEPGEYVTYGTDSLRCNGKTHVIEVLNYHYPVKIKTKPDSVLRSMLRAKACNMLIE